jgi:hypothetical protein
LTSLIKPIASFFTERKFKFLVEGEFSTPRKIATRVPQCSVLTPILYSTHINDALAAPVAHLALFAADTSIYATEEQKRRVLRKLQRSLTAVNYWCEGLNIKINEGESNAIYFSRRLSVSDEVLQIN